MDRRQAIQLMAQEIRGYGCDNLHVFDGTWEGGIYLQQISDEIAGLIFDLGKLKKEINLLEIGSASGGNIFLFDAFLNLDRVVLIDDNNHVRAPKRPEILKHVNYVEYVGSSFSFAAREFVEKLGFLYDVIFIDGDHSYNGVRNDYQLYSKFLNDDGILVFHDTVACPGVVKLVREVETNASAVYRVFGTYVGIKKHLGITAFQKRRHHGM